MRELILFCEDSFHEKFMDALIRRFAAEFDVAAKTRFFSSRGGLPRMHHELKEFLRDLSRSRQQLPDQLIVVVDANCKGYNERKNAMAAVVAQSPNLQGIVSYAIPDPHIERWMLVDNRAFQAIFQRGCNLPAIKCQKDEYKRLLREEIRASGIEAPLGGEEFAADVVMEMDLGSVEIREASLGLLLKALKGLFNRWSQQ